MREYRAVIASYLSEAGCRFEFYETRTDEDPSRVVRAACDRGVELVIVAGGDGTVGAAVQGMVGTGVPLGILPVGTGNILARGLGLPRRLEDAVALIFEEHHTVRLDAMRVAGRHFVLNVSSGISSHSIHDTTREDKRRYGKLAYVRRITQHLFGFRTYRFDLVLDGYNRPVEATELLVSNGTLMEQLPTVLGPRETFCDGRIDVYVFNGRSLLDYAGIVFRRLLRLPNRDERLLHFSVSRGMTIAAHGRSRLVQADGESLSTTPVEITVVPGAVPVIVPKQG